MVVIPDLFSSWIKGREAAINANWNDLKNYNSVLGGQLSNAFTMATFDAKAQQEAEKARNQTLRNYYGNIFAANDVDKMLAERPGLLSLLSAYSNKTVANADALAQQQINAKIAELNSLINSYGQGARTGTPANPNTGNAVPAFNVPDASTQMTGLGAQNNNASGVGANVTEQLNQGREAVNSGTASGNFSAFGDNSYTLPTISMQTPSSLEQTSNPQYGNPYTLPRT